MKTLDQNKLRESVCLYDEECGEITYGHLLIDIKAQHKKTNRKVVKSATSIDRDFSYHQGVSLSA
jgi:hypothetical protein